MIQDEVLLAIIFKDVEVGHKRLMRFISKQLLGYKNDL